MKNKSIEEIKKLDTYTMSDQPETCSNCGSRSEFDEHLETDQATWLPRVIQHHNCLSCGYEWIAVPEGDE